ncbi:hypothetical protein J6590_101332 [Homalodisca vitripennis]|nr:hypothetical protein J6590_101332 [Homalodisca vitripennis]
MKESVDRKCSYASLRFWKKKEKRLEIFKFKLRSHESSIQSDGVGINLETEILIAGDSHLAWRQDNIMALHFRGISPQRRAKQIRAEERRGVVRRGVERRGEERSGVEWSGEQSRAEETEFFT